MTAVIHDLGCSEPCTCGAWDRAAKGETVTYTFTIYEAADGWRWRCTAPNGRIVADSGEAYVTKANAVRAVRMLKADTAGTKSDRQLVRTWIDTGADGHRWEYCEFDDGTLAANELGP